MRRLLIVVAAVIVAVAGGLLLLYTVLPREELRRAVEARLSATLGEPVSIGRFGISLFPPAASGEDVRVGEAHVEAPSVRIGRVHVRPRLGSLLSGTPIIERVELEGLVVSVLRSGDSWQVPSGVPAPAGSGRGGIVIERVTLSDARVRIFDDRAGQGAVERGSIDGIRAELLPADDGLRIASLAARIGRAAVAGEARVDADAVHLELAADRVSDEDLPALLALMGAGRPDRLRLPEPASLSAIVRVDRAAGRLSGRGTLRAPQVLLDPVRLGGFEAPFTLVGRRIEFAPARFSLYGGAHDGAASVDLAADPPAWAVDSRITNADVGALVATLIGGAARVDGTGSLTGTLRGRMGEPLAQTAAGRVRLEVVDGAIRDFPLLAFVNRTLRLTGQQGRDTQFHRLSATLAIASGAATMDDLVLDAAHLRVEAAGRVGADGSLDLRGTAALSPERSAEAAASVRELTALRNARGEVEVPLTISGSIGNPRFGLDLQSAMRRGIADELRRRLNRIIR